jgi:glycerol-3-phosphate acyltransferase PlsY
VWLRCRGGKGVATFIGVLVALSPLVAVGFGLVWLAVAAATRYSSLAGLTASAATPLMLWATGRPADALLFTLLAVLSWIKHASNLRRLLTGTESKIGKGKSPPGDAD